MTIKDFLSKKDHAIEYTASLVDGIATMKKNRTKFLVLLQNEKPCAVFSDRNLLEYLYKQTKLNIRLDLIASKVLQKVLITDSIEHLINLFLSLDLRFVVVVDTAGHYVGIVNKNSLIHWYETKEKSANTPMRDLPLMPIKFISLPYSFKKIVDFFYEEKEEVIFLGNQNNIQGIITINNISFYVDSLDSDGNIVATKEHLPELIDIHANLNDVLQKAHEEEYEQIVLENRQTKCHYSISVKDIIHSCKTPYEKLLEVKFQANNDFHNSLDIAMIEAYKIEDNFIVSWLNSYAKQHFHIELNSSINNLLPTDIWDTIFQSIKAKKNVNNIYCSVYGLQREIKVSYYKHDEKIIIKLTIGVANKNKTSKSPKSVDFFNKKTLYNHIFYQNFMGIVYTSFDGMIMDVNPYIENFVGYSKEELVGKNYFADILVGDESKSARRMQQEFERNMVFNTVVTRKFIRKDGVNVWGLLSVSTMKNENSNERYVAVFVQDYTNYYETQKNLIRQKETLSMIFDTVEDFIFFKDSSLKYVSCNKSMLNFLGFKKNELIGKEEHDILSKTQEEEFVKIVKEDGNKLVVRQKIENKDKSKSIIGETTLKPRYDKEGNFYGIVGTVHNITSEIESEERQRIIRGVFDNTDEGIIVTNNKNEIVMINPAFTKTTGYSFEEIKGKNPSILRSNANDHNFYARMWSDIVQKGHWRGEIWNKRKNGEVYPELLTISLLKDESGKIVNYIGIFSDISEIKEKQAKLEFLAHRDPLTGLANRVSLGKALNQLIKKSSAQHSKIAVLFFDLDHFKEINDTYGHSAGDKLLTQVAKRLQKRVKERDFLARVGGDEFVVILEGFSEKSYVENTVERIANVFSLPFIIDDRMFNVTSTFGIALYPEDGMDTGTLLKNADAAMYQSKKSKRNSHMFYTADMTDSLFEKMETLADIRRAIKNDEFTLYYQPQFDLPSNKLIGVEALARWEHPIKGLIFPDGFIDLAEESQLIIPLGRMLLRKVCETIKRWLTMGVKMENFKVAINLSAVQIAHDDVYRLLKDVTREIGISPKYIEMELTETSIMNDPNGAIMLFNKVKSLGATIAIDDFGTGYSSLAYLKKFPVDKIKIDRSFIMDIPKDLDDMAITKAVLALSKSLKIEALAEGIEDSVQKDFLLGEGCTNGQGYFYSKPIHVKDLEAQYLQALL